MSTKLIAFITRCPQCGFKIVCPDEYGDYNEFVVKDGVKTRVTEDRRFDPDWMLDQHRRRKHRKPHNTNERKNNG